MIKAFKVSKGAVENSPTTYISRSLTFYQTQHNMASQAQAAADTVKEAVANAADKVAQLTTSDNTPNLVLDELTGESVSKSEFKKRQKQRANEAKKAEREATRQPPPQAKRKPANDEADEAQLNPNVSHNAHTSKKGRKVTDGTCASNTESSGREPSTACWRPTSPTRTRTSSTSPTI